MMKTSLKYALFYFSAGSLLACGVPVSSSDLPERGPIPEGKTDWLGSCVDHCWGRADQCWCDELCEGYGDCCPDKQEVCDTAPPPPLELGLPPATGQVNCFDHAEQSLTCPAAEEPFFGQDANYARHPMTLSTVEDVVQDLNTELSWTRCPLGQQGEACTGAAQQVNWRAAFDHCQGLTTEGQDDWRLPTVMELVMTLDFSSGVGVLPEGSFPNRDPGHIWTVNQFGLKQSGQLYPVMNVAYTVWPGDNHGLINHLYQYQEASVMCVRGTTELSYANPFPPLYKPKADGSIKHKVTDLAWISCPLGLSRSDCSQGTAELMEWGEALAACESLSAHGHQDWRLPNVKELFLLVGQRPNTDVTALKSSLPQSWINDQPYYQSTELWSSTSRDGHEAYGLSLFNGLFGPSHKTDHQKQVLCLRSVDP